jgi:hypothetical protein
VINLQAEVNRLELLLREDAIKLGGLQDALSGHDEKIAVLTSELMIGAKELAQLQNSLDGIFSVSLRYLMHLIYLVW